MKIRDKLLFSVLATALVIFSGIVYFSYTSSRAALTKEIHTKAHTMLDLYTTRLNGSLEQVEDVAKDLGSVTEALSLTTADNIDALIKKLLERDPTVYGSTIAFEPNTFGTATLFGPYYHRSGDGLVYVDLATPDYNYPAWDWYKIPVTLGKPYWIEPYIDVGGGNTAMTTYSYPFFRNGKVWGVATADVTLQELTDMVKSIKVGDTGYAFLVSSLGKFISMRTNEWQLKRTIFDIADELKNDKMRTLGQEMTQGKTGFIEMTDPVGGKDAWFVYGPVAPTGWSLAIVFPKDELLAEVTALHRNMLFIGAGGILLLFAVIYLVAQRIGAPIESLAARAERLAAGDFSGPIELSHRHDEIGVLTRTFNEMQEALAQLIEKLHEDKEMFDIAFAQMSDGIVLLDPAWKILKSNKAADQLMGLPSEQPFVAHLMERFDSAPPLEGLKESHHEVCAFTFTNRTATQRLACVFTPVRDDKNQLREIVLSARKM